MVYPELLVAGTLLPNAAAVIGTCAASQRFVVTKATITNTSAVTAYAATVHRVPSGGSVLPANMVCNAETLSPGETRTIRGLQGQNLLPGDTVQAFSGTANVLSLMVSGYYFPLNGGN